MSTHEFMIIVLRNENKTNLGDKCRNKNQNSCNPIVELLLTRKIRKSMSDVTTVSRALAPPTELLATPTRTHTKINEHILHDNTQHHQDMCVHGGWINLLLWL